MTIGDTVTLAVKTSGNDVHGCALICSSSIYLWLLLFFFALACFGSWRETHIWRVGTGQTTGQTKGTFRSVAPAPF